MKSYVYVLRHCCSIECELKIMYVSELIFQENLLSGFFWERNVKACQVTL